MVHLQYVVYNLGRPKVYSRMLAPQLLQYSQATLYKAVRILTVGIWNTQVFSCFNGAIILQ